MEHLKSFWTEYSYYIVGAVAAPVVFVLYRKIFGHSTHASVPSPPNTVVLHQMSRGPYAPSMSNFPIKLETYLRMAKIPYINHFSSQFSPKGKTPFMTYNGEVVSDSQFCIEYLNKKQNVDLNKSLSKEERAVAKAIQVMVEEHLYWTFGYFRWVSDKEKKIVKLGIPAPRFVYWLIVRNVRQALHGQGIGRHTKEEIRHIMLTDLQALADYLGNKPFIMGQTPCEVDCSVFGLLSQLIWHATDDVLTNVVQEKFPTLYSYTLRMKERFWPDWDDCITHGGTREATK